MNKFPNLSDWLQFISEQHHKEMELGLDRVHKVASQLGIHGFNCPVITVAGTNGKGSSIAMLESIYSEAGYTTGAYTSPHLTVFNERIRIGGQFCSDEALCAAFQRIEDNRNEIPLTYFEFATLAAFIIFSDAPLDVVLLEVGLGGRLDAVNIFAPDVALITRIGVDHADWLGDNREDIGREKAGIIHPSSLAVIADPEPPASLVSVAEQTAQSSYQLNVDYFHTTDENVWSWNYVDSSISDLPLPPMAGSAQLDNAAGVLMAVHSLQHKLSVSRDAIRQGLAATELAGRFQVIAGDPVVVLDVAHNEDSAALLAENLARQPVQGRTLAVFGMLGDKDIGAIIPGLSDCIDAWYVGGLDAARGASAEDLARSLEASHVQNVSQFSRIEAAWEAAKAVAGKGDRIVVFGSFHTVGAIICATQSL
jgi:dihydrofolate synthase/folylpolyglutamate synthase